METPTTNSVQMDFSRNAHIYGDNDYDDIEDEAQSMPYYEDEEETIEVNDDAYWDIYYDPTGPDNLHTSFSDSE